MQRMSRPLSKFSVSSIIVDHYSTFRYYETKKVSVPDYVLYLGVPAGVFVASILGPLRASNVADILAAVAILTGLVFNAVLLVADLSARAREIVGEPRRSQVIGLADQLRANITYAVLLGLLLSLILGAIAMFTNDSKPISNWLTGLVLFLGLQLLLTILMVLKRVRALFHSFFIQPEETTP
jgi:hypothetical protein